VGSAEPVAPRAVPAISPSVTAISRRSRPRCLSHQRTSFSTHGDAAALGDASRMNQRDCSRAASIVPQSSGVADRLVSSRKTRNARNCRPFRANACRARCRRGASCPSIAWL
jgi:hypothetical protein